MCDRCSSVYLWGSVREDGCGKWNYENRIAVDEVETEKW